MTADTYRRSAPDLDLDDVDELAAYDTDTQGANAADRALDAVSDLASATWAMYRQHLRPVALLAVCAAIGAIVRDGNLRFIVVLPAVAAAVAVVYARSKHRGHRAAQERGHLDTGQLSGRHADRINADALRVATITAICGAWVLAANVTNPATLAGWIVWVVFGLIPWAVFTTPIRTRAEHRRLRIPAGPRRAAAPDDATPDDTASDDAASDDANATVRPPASSRRAPRVTDPAPASYRLPTVSLTPAAKASTSVRDLDAQVAALGALLERRRVSARVVGYQRGPTITRFGIELVGDGLVEQVLRLTKNIAYALKVADTAVRMEAPVSGQSLIGVEVPNEARDTVSLSQVLAARRPGVHPLTVALGVTAVDASPFLANIAEMPHLVVAGASGGGKSGCLNSIICSLLLNVTPDEVGMVFFDPKKVELTQYRGIPHLVFDVVTKSKTAITALEWLDAELDRRTDELEAAGVRNITEYNEAVASGAYQAPKGSRHVVEPFRHLLVVVDELADLMLSHKDEVEPIVVRIAALGRAPGIHLILATQDPRAEVLTGLIKSNVPWRIAFQTATREASQIILGVPGAEKLLGKGDALVRTGDQVALIRLQSPWVSTADIAEIVRYWKTQPPPAGHRPAMPIPTAPVADDADDTNPNHASTVGDSRTGPETVLDAARRLAESHPDGFDKAQIAAETPHLMNATRDRALTDLTRGDASPLVRVPGERGRYTLRTTPTE